MMWTLIAASVAPSAAALPAFERALAAQPSATAALTQWCAARHLARPARIVAQRQTGADAPPPADLRDVLHSAQAPIGYRHVRLLCGGVVMSQAHNWYVPGRLTPAMNTALATGDIPFGQVTAALHFTREPLALAPADCPRDAIVRHRALLRLPDRRPLALVVECYTAANLRVVQ